MLRSIGLWRAATRRSRAEWPVSLASFLLLLCGTTLLAAGTLYADTVSSGGLRRSVADASPSGRTVAARVSTVAATAEAADAAVRTAVTRALGPAAGEVVRVERAVAFAPGASADDAVRQLVAIEAAEGIESHATLAAGRWPAAAAGPLEASLPVAAAERLGVSVGDTLSLPGPTAGSTLDLRIVGTWRPVSRHDAYWLGDVLELDGVAKTAGSVTTGPAIVVPGALEALGGNLDVQWRGLVDPDRLSADDLPALRASLDALGGAVRAGLPHGPTVEVTTDLPAVLGAVERSVLVARSGILLLTIQFAILAGYAVLLVAGMLAERRRPEVALLRARGAGAGHVALLALLEGLLLAVPAALLAPFVAAGIVRLLAAAGPLAGLGIADRVVPTPTTFVAAFVAAAIYLLALVLPAAGPSTALAGVRASIGRQVGRTLPQRLGLDLALVAIAVIAIWQLRLYGAPLTRDARGVLGIDPLLVAAPAIGLLAGVLLAARLIPRIAELADRAAGGRRTLVGPMSAHELARRPLRYTRSAMLLMLAAALGTFAVTEAATWSRSQVDQADYRAAVDVRVVGAPTAGLPSWATTSALAGTDGVQAAMPVLRQSLDIGRSIEGVDLLGVEPAVAAGIVHFPEADRATVPGLLRALAARSAAGPTIDGTPARIALEVDARLGRLDLAGPQPATPVPAPTPDPAVDPVAAWSGMDATIVVQDATGWLQEIDLPAVQLGGGRERLEAPLTTAVGDRTASLVGPLRVVAIELHLATPPFESAAGTVQLVGLLAGGDGAPWQAVAVDPTGLGWSWTRVDLGGTQAYEPPAGDPGLIVVGTGQDQSPPFSGPPSEPGATFRLTAASTGTRVLPVIAGTAFLTATGTEVGDRIAARSEGQDLTLEIVGATERFPPLDPTRPFLVVDGPSLEQLRFAAQATTSPPDEWWLATAPGRSGAVAETVRDGLGGTGGIPAGAVIDRAAVEAGLTSDPVALGVTGALGLGAIAALVLATIGFIVGATISASERLGEFALLRALGLSSGGLSAWLTVENAFLLVTSLVAGTALGLLLAWVVLPVSTLTAAGETPVPAPVVVVPWPAILAVGALAALVLVVAVALATRQLPGRRVAGVLRAWEG